MRDENLWQEPGGRRDDTRDHGLSRSWKVDVCGKKKKRSSTPRWIANTVLMAQHRSPYSEGVPCYYQVCYDIDKLMHFLPQLSDFVPLRNGFYSFRAQTA